MLYFSADLMRGRMKYDSIQRVIKIYNSPDIQVSKAYEDGGLDPLWPRLERAAMNQVELGAAAASRYGIWANTVRDNILEAMRLLQSGQSDDATPLLVRSANALSAFSEIQHLLDRDNQS